MFLTLIHSRMCRGNVWATGRKLRMGRGENMNGKRMKHGIHWEMIRGRWLEDKARVRVFNLNSQLDVRRECIGNREGT